MEIKNRYDSIKYRSLKKINIIDNKVSFAK